jgi:hypothetical protein
LGYNSQTNIQVPALVKFQQGDWVIPALKEGEDEYLQVHRQAMWFWEETDKQEGMLKADGHWLESRVNTAPQVKKPPGKETRKRMLSSNVKRVSIAEEDDVDMHWPGMGLPISFPVLMEEDDDIAINYIEWMVYDAPDIIKSGWNPRQIRKELEELDKIVQEFSRASYPKKYVRNNRPHTAYQLRWNVDADKMNKVLMAVIHNHSARINRKGPLMKKDIPRLCEEWMKSCEDIMRGALE